jgi:hypothetical protein
MRYKYAPVNSEGIPYTLKGEGLSDQLREVYELITVVKIERMT